MSAYNTVIRYYLEKPRYTLKQIGDLVGLSPPSVAAKIREYLRQRREEEHERLAAMQAEMDAYLLLRMIHADGSRRVTTITVEAKGKADYKQVYQHIHTK